MEALTFQNFWHNLASAPTANPNFPTADSDDDDDGSLFELEFAAPPRKETQSEKDPCFRESKNISMVSPKDLFSKNRVMPIEPTSKPQSPLSSHISQTKFRGFGLHRSKSQKTEKPEKTEKRLVEFFVEKSKAEKAPIEAKFSRAKSSRDESRRVSRDYMQKYLKLIRPLYLRVSRKKQSEKGKFSETASFTSSSSWSPPPRTAPASKKVGLGAVRMQLGKSRSASASATATGGASPPAASRRDDSLALQHDGIQSAILHCKRSLNSSTEFFQLPRSTSSPCDQKSMDLTGKSS